MAIDNAYAYWCTQIAHEDQNFTIYTTTATKNTCDAGEGLLTGASRDNEYNYYNLDEKTKLLFDASMETEWGNYTRYGAVTKITEELLAKLPPAKR
jgi:hypothetical protein